MKLERKKKKEKMRMMSREKVKDEERVDVE
jgi:hypothetical protein